MSRFPESFAKVAGAAGGVARIFHRGALPMRNFLRTPWACILFGAFIFAVASTVGACTRAPNIHDTPEVRNQPCINCHAQAFASATNPMHVGALPQTCKLCHSTRTWIPATVSASAASHPWFPLANKHANLMCATCHTKGYQVGNTPKDCVGCHQGSFDTANNPSHKGFPTTCNTCHSDMGWVPAVASGNAVGHPWFPLANKHANLMCATCHTKGYQPGNTPTDCVGCHQMNYDTANNPPHVGLPTTCATCHTDVGWMPSTFAHPWPLDGKHTTAPCASCHTGSPPRYAGTPTACVDCHLANFQSSTFPGHNTFPQTCADCHSTTAWTGASASAHPEANFPIKTGSHSNPGIVCSDCHIAALGSPVAGKNTDCVHCHLGAHMQPSIDASHVALKVMNYPGPNAAQPNFCLSCHQKG
jgi:Cytochrome c7 and related cytochrome c